MKLLQIVSHTIRMILDSYVKEVFSLKSKNGLSNHKTPGTLVRPRDNGMILS